MISLSLYPPRRWALPAASLLLLVTACGGPREYARSDSPYAMPPSAGRFFATTYDQVNEKYVTQLPMADVAMSGIGNLRKLDGAFAVAQHGEQVELLYDGNSLGNFDIPRRSDASSWSQITLAMIEKGRHASPTLRDAESEAIYQAVVEGVIKKLDTYSRYSGREPARDARAARDGFGGIGITLEAKDNKILVGNVMDETPAARGGLRSNDAIVAIDGESTTGLEIRDVVRKLRGPIGAAVGMSLGRDGVAAPIQVSLTRALIVPPSVSYKREGRVAHLRVLAFNQRTTDALHDAIRRAQREIGPDLEGIVLDLRGNLGGLLDQAISVADTFLPEGQIVATRGRHRASGQTSYATKGDIGENIPLVVLVNGMSASASEIVAAALQDNGRAVIVGSTTFGKGSVQTVIPMPNEGEFILTWARFHAPSGYPIADLGVIPGVCTSGDGSSAKGVLDAVRDGKITTAATMASWRAADHSDMGRMKELRTICTPETKEREVEPEIAKALLADRGLFARALQKPTLTATLR